MTFRVRAQKAGRPCKASWQLSLQRLQQGTRILGLKKIKNKKHINVRLGRCPRQVSDLHYWSDPLERRQGIVSTQRQIPFITTTEKRSSTTELLNVQSKQKIKCQHHVGHLYLSLCSSEIRVYFRRGGIKIIRTQVGNNCCVTSCMYSTKIKSRFHYRWGGAHKTLPLDESHWKLLVL